MKQLLNSDGGDMWANLIHFNKKFVDVWESNIVLIEYGQHRIHLIGFLWTINESGTKDDQIEYRMPANGMECPSSKDTLRGIWTFWRQECTRIAKRMILRAKCPSAKGTAEIQSSLAANSCRRPYLARSWPLTGYVWSGGGPDDKRTADTDTLLVAAAVDDDVLGADHTVRWMVSASPDCLSNGKGSCATMVPDCHTKRWSMRSLNAMRMCCRYVQEKMWYQPRHPPSCASAARWPRRDPVAAPPSVVGFRRAHGSKHSVAS